MRFEKEGKRIVDERIVNTQNRIYKEAFYLTMAICLLSIIVKFSLYGADISLVSVEILLIIIPSLFYAVRIVRLGIYSDETEIHDRRSRIPMSLKTIIIGLGFGVAIAVFFGIRSSILYGSDDTRLWYFILVFFASFMIYCPFFVGCLAITHAVANRISKNASPKE